MCFGWQVDVCMHVCVCMCVCVCVCVHVRVGERDEVTVKCFLTYKINI